MWELRGSDVFRDGVRVASYLRPATQEDIARLGAKIMANSTVTADVSAVATPAAEGKATPTPAAKKAVEKTAAPSPKDEAKPTEKKETPKSTPVKAAAKKSAKPAEAKKEESPKKAAANPPAEAPKTTAKKTAKKVTEAPKPVGKRVSEKVLVGDGKKATPAAKTTKKAATAAPKATPTTTKVVFGLPLLKMNIYSSEEGAKLRKSQISVLSVLLNSGVAMGRKQIAELSKVDPGDLTETLGSTDPVKRVANDAKYFKSLISLGYVQEENLEEIRGMAYSLTAEGKAKAKELARA